MRRALAPVALASLFVVGLQLAVFTSLRFAGVVVMVVWLWPMAMGLAGYTGLALVAAVVAGLFFDTHAATPFGLSILVALALAWGASRLGKEGVGDLDSAAWWVTPALGAVGGFLAPAIFVALGALSLDFGLWRGGLVDAMAVNAVAFFVLARPATRLARALGRLSGSRR